MLLELLARITTRLQRRDVDREVDAELAFHVEMQTEANRARGMNLDDARRAALHSLGGADQVKEAVRDSRGMWLDSVWQDVRYGVRVLRRSPVYAAGVVATLGLGIGATTAVFSVADAAALRPLP